MSKLLVPLTTTGLTTNVPRNIVAKVTRSPIQSKSLRVGRVFVTPSVTSSREDYLGYAAVMTDQDYGENSDAWRGLTGVPLVHGAKTLSHLVDGDIICINGRAGFVRTLYRIESNNNVIFATDRCNSNCLMCSQPPKKIDDREKVQENLAMIRLIDQPPEFLGITGGEPTLLRDDLFEIMRALKKHLPDTFVNMLTNGRMFCYEDFAENYAAVGHPLFRAAIPIYSDVPELHDHVVQAEQAFVQTVRGIYNLAALRQRIEIRVVIHKLTYERLPQLAEFIFRNMPFVEHIALMGLEIMGYVRKNLEMLWIDPVDYQDELFRAVRYLNGVGMHVSIYNHQLCVLRKELWPFARKSISDFKNIYLDECEKCSLRDRCGGLFKSSHSIHSKHIKAIKGDEVLQAVGLSQSNLEGSR